MTEIHVDADGCPVIAEVLRVADRHGLPVVLVANSWVRAADSPNVRRVVVPEEPDAADRWIAAHAGPGDIVITADVPLAARAVDAGAVVVRPDGREFTEASIGMDLAARDLMAHLRDARDAAGDLAGGRGPTPFSPRDRSRFLDTLERTARRLRRADPGGGRP